MSPRIQRFLIVSGWVLFGVGSIRVYRLLRNHAEDPRFAPHLLVAVLSLWIASSIIRVGLRKKALNKRSAISLIRSGSILMMIWSYRLVLQLRNIDEAGLKLQAYLAPFYIVFGTVVMCVGLKISRILRKNNPPETAKAAASLNLPPIEEPLKK